MRFECPKVKLTQIKQIVTKSGRNMTFVRLLNEVDYSTAEFPLSANCDIKGLIQLNDYKAEVDIDNGFTNIMLYPLASNSK